MVECVDNRILDRKEYSASLEEARENAFCINWNFFEASTPNILGRVVIDEIKINEIIPYLNWRFFFQSWNFPTKFHTLTNVSMCGHCRAQWLVSFRENEREPAQKASKLYDDAVEMLQKFIDLEAEYVKAVFGLYEAYSENDTIFIDGKPFPMLRQQVQSDKNIYFCLSDFIAPRTSGKKDYVGAFAVTAGAGADYLLHKYEKEGDEYSALLMKSLLDRLAEAATEWLHAKVRREYWGYAADENLTVAELFAVKYRGIRPAVGYPSIPDQSVNFPLHQLLLSEEIGISLTENGVMYPNASVSGLFFAHPQAKYFAVGEISEEQVSDYAQRKKVQTEEIRKFLLANLHQ